MSAIENQTAEIKPDTNILYRRRYTRAFGKYYKFTMARVSTYHILKAIEFPNTDAFEREWTKFHADLHKFVLFSPNCADKDAYIEWVTEWKKAYHALTQASRFCKDERKTGTRETSNWLDGSARMIERHRQLRVIANKMLIARAVYKAAYGQMNYK